MGPLKAAFIFYDNYAPLDVFGPMQAMNCSFGLSSDGISPNKKKHLFEIINVGYNKPQSVKEPNGSIKIQTGMESNGPVIYCDKDLTSIEQVDMILIPGGTGSRSLVDDSKFVEQLSSLVNKTPIVLSVCTGAALLAKTGFLDSKKATSNKIAWQWVTSKNNKVDWQSQPRWTGNIDPQTKKGYMTAGGVAAGIDMMLAVINILFGSAVVLNTQNMMEYEWTNNNEKDPFSSLCPKY